jgi:malonyl-CoA decarboxylase
MTLLGDLLSTVFERSYVANASQDKRDIEILCLALLENNSEGTNRQISQSILDKYDFLDDEAKLVFFNYLSAEMSFDPAQTELALQAYQANESKKTYQDFVNSIETKRQIIFRRLNLVTGATEKLVAMRKDLLRLSRKNPSIAQVDVDLKALLKSWFNHGFLVLRPINWQSPAHILEKIIAYEAVHEIESWSDLQSRLQPADRRCFAFFHPSMPDEPLIFVEVALVKGVPNSVQGILSGSRNVLSEDDADTATFYSISNCQAGLAGISFGNSLIKQVAAELKRNHEGLKTFVTLSPIPSYSKWAIENGVSGDEQEQLQKAAYYLTKAKGRNNLPYDPVARFHLGNGASVHAIHANADTSPKGMQQSAGMMVNYLYDLNKVASNHTQFAEAGKIAESKAIKTLAVAGQDKK